MLRALGAEVQMGDLRDRAAVLGACAGVHAVIHAGALSSPWGRAAEFHAVNVNGTRHVVDGCTAHGVARFVHISSPSVTFDGRDHRDATEQAPYPRRFASVYSATKKLAEDLVHAAARDGLPVVTLRPKAMFGPGDTALLPRLLRAGRNGRLAQIGDGTNLVDLTYVDNVVHATLLALEVPRAAGQTYTITNDAHVPLWNVVHRVLTAARLETKLRRVAVPVALAAAAVMELRARLDGGEPTMTRYSVLILARTQTYDITAARRDLGYSPVVSIDDALERTLANMDLADGA